MKVFVFFSLILSAAISTPAFAHPNTEDMTCAEAANLVSSSGAIVLDTGDGTYDRYVANASYCLRDETTVPAWVPTKDSNQCFVGYLCQPKPHH